MKRFTIGSHNVTKDNQHVSFPRVLDMAPYCTAECLEVRMYVYTFILSKGNIMGHHFLCTYLP